MPGVWGGLRLAPVTAEVLVGIQPVGFCGHEVKLDPLRVLGGSRLDFLGVGSADQEDLAVPVGADRPVEELDATSRA